MGPSTDGPSSFTHDVMRAFAKHIAGAMALTIAAIMSADEASANARPYQPAVLRLSYTNVEGKPTSFIDQTLIPAKGSPVGKRTKVNNEAFKTNLRQFYKQLSSMAPISVANPSDPARKMYDLLIRPLKQELEEQKITTLLISMDLELQSIPIAALHDGEKWFGQEFAFSVTPSMSLMPRIDNSDGNRDDKHLLAGSSQFKQLAPLPLVEQEINKIAGFTNATVALNENFSRERLFEEAESEDTNIIHLATHAEFIPGRPGQSKIHMQDGSFTMDDLRQLRLARQGKPLNLFTLSACRTAMGDSNSEHGLAGLALLAGAQSAIGTLWYVDDIATSIFFIRFYKWLNEGHTKSEAIRLSRNELINGLLKVENGKVVDGSGDIVLDELSTRQAIKLKDGLRHPYFWAAPVLLGKPW